MSKVTRMQKGELTRSIRCNFCGQEHRRHSQEERDCRKRHRRGQGPAAKPPEAPRAEREDGRGPSTLRERDPFGGNPRAHLVARKLKEGRSRHNVAKLLGLPKSEVDKIAQILDRENT